MIYNLRKYKWLMYIFIAFAIVYVAIGFHIVGGTKDFFTNVGGILLIVDGIVTFIICAYMLLTSLWVDNETDDELEPYD